MIENIISYTVVNVFKAVKDIIFIWMINWSFSMVLHNNFCLAIEDSDFPSIFRIFREQESNQLKLRIRCRNGKLNNPQWKLWNICNKKWENGESLKAKIWNNGIVKMQLNCNGNLILIDIKFLHICAFPIPICIRLKHFSSSVSVFNVLHLRPYFPTFFSFSIRR